VEFGEDVCGPPEHGRGPHAQALQKYVEDPLSGHLIKGELEACDTQIYVAGEASRSVAWLRHPVIH